MPDKVDGTNPQVNTHVVKSMIIGNPGAWIPFPSHSLLVYLGPKVLMLALDCRAERKLHQVCTKETYAKTFGEVRKMKGIEQLVLLLGVPIGMSHPCHNSFCLSEGDLLTISLPTNVIPRALPRKEVEPPQHPSSTRSIWSRRNGQ